MPDTLGENPVEEISRESLEGVIRLTRDLRQAATELTPKQLRILVDLYYQVQQSRMRAHNQLRHAKEEPNAWISMMSRYMERMEKVVGGGLLLAADDQAVGRWAMAQIGVGPVLAGALQAYIDITKTPTVSGLWALAGLDPTAVWAKGEKRPWNANLKVVRWKLSDSFVKQRARDGCLYGQVYAERKGLEVARNDAGRFVALAEKTLGMRQIKDADTRAWYEGRYPAGTTAAAVALDQARREPYLTRVRLAPGEGQPMLPLGRLELRARRVAVKLFLCHYFEVSFYEHYHTLPPLPYILNKEPEVHTHYIPPPGYEAIFAGRTAHSPGVSHRATP